MNPKVKLVAALRAERLELESNRHVWIYSGPYDNRGDVPLIHGKWYYSDETEQANGPFDTWRQAAKALEGYVATLLVAPRAMQMAALGFKVRFVPFDGG